MSGLSLVERGLQVETKFRVASHPTTIYEVRLMIVKFLLMSLLRLFLKEETTHVNTKTEKNRNGKKEYLKQMSNFHSQIRSNPDVGSDE